MVVEGTDADENGGGIATGLLEASVQEGASIDLVMEKGGLVSLTTSWLTIESIEYNVGDVPEDVTLEIDLGDGVSWDASSIQTVNSKQSYLPDKYHSIVNLKPFNMTWR